MEARTCEQLLDGVRDAVISADENFRVRFLNSAAERVLGVARAQAEGESLHLLLPGEYDAGEPVVHGGGWRVERLAEGWAVIAEAPADGEGKKLWLQHAVEAQQLAAVGQVAAGVAHEIGAPLTAISVAVEYLLKSEIGQHGAAARDLEMILAQTRRIARLARSLVDLARPGEPTLGVIDLNAVVSQGFDLMEKQLRRNAVESVLVLDPSLPPMLGDANQLQQVLINLLLNAQRAVQAPGASERRVEVLTRATADANELVVTDWGPGVAPDDLSRIFLPFFSRAGGAGLGLSLARNIVHRHGGTIQLESQLGRGASFTVRLPRDGNEPAG